MRSALCVHAHFMYHWFFLNDPSGRFYCSLRCRLHPNGKPFCHQKVVIRAVSRRIDIMLYSLSDYSSLSPAAQLQNAAVSARRVTLSGSRQAAGNPHSRNRYKRVVFRALRGLRTMRMDVSPFLQFIRTLGRETK